jgi:hypothetical protein
MDMATRSGRLRFGRRSFVSTLGIRRRHIYVQGAEEFPPGVFHLVLVVVLDEQQRAGAERVALAVD